MSAVTAGEVKPGLVVHLDTTTLRQSSRSETNAIRSPDRAVQGPHYFLVLEVDARDVVTMVPLFSKRAPGSKLLDESKKSGFSAKWRGETSYFSCWQFWRTPVADLVAASGAEESSEATRRAYDGGATATMSEILAWLPKNKEGFTPV